jgi:hypothetical protein
MTPPFQWKNCFVNFMFGRLVCRKMKVGAQALFGPKGVGHDGGTSHVTGIAQRAFVPARKSLSKKSGDARGQESPAVRSFHSSQWKRIASQAGGVSLALAMIIRRRRPRG